MSTYIRTQQKNHKDYSDSFTLLDEFLRNLAIVQGLAIHTTNNYYMHLRLFFRYIKLIRDELDEAQFEELCIRDISFEEVAKISEDDVYDFLAFCAARGDVASTRSAKLSSIRKFFNFCCTSYPDSFAKNPTTRIRNPKLPKRLPIFPNEEQSIDILNAATRSVLPERDFCIVTIMLNCGLRVSELVNLNVNSIKETSLRIKGKGNKERMVPLNESCLYAINKWLTARAAIKDKLDQEALFISPRTHNRLTVRGTEKIVERILNLAGLAGCGFSPHKLRHAAATLMHENGADVLELQAILGHDNVATTQIYTHVNTNRLKTVTDNNPLNIFKDKE